MRIPKVGCRATPECVNLPSPHSQRLMCNRAMAVCRLWLLLLLVCAAASPQRCPGGQDENCGRACQTVVCRALDHLTNATYNPSYSAWARYKGWTGSTADCMADSIHSTHKLPSFCSGYGVECCESAGIKRGQCSIRGAVTGMVLEVNFLNGSISDPLLLSALGRLHACGLRKLVLQGNDLSGPFSDAWGDLTELTPLNLGKRARLLAQPRVSTAEALADKAALTVSVVCSIWRCEALEGLNVQHSSKQQEVSSRASEQPAGTGGQPERAAATVSFSDHQQEQELQAQSLALQQLQPQAQHSSALQTSLPDSAASQLPPCKTYPVRKALLGAHHLGSFAFKGLRNSRGCHIPDRYHTCPGMAQC